jgi:hypothetical protein
MYIDKTVPNGASLNTDIEQWPRPAPLPRGTQGPRHLATYPKDPTGGKKDLRVSKLRRNRL